MSTTASAAAPTANSATNKTRLPGKDEQAWKAEIHKAPEYNGSLPTADIVPDPHNRKDRDPVALQELLDMIKAEGLLQPIVLRPCPKYPDACAKILSDGPGKGRWAVLKSTRSRDNTDPIEGYILYVGEDEKDANRAVSIYRNGDGYQIIAGERRWRAHVLGKLTTIRAFIHRSETETSAVFKQVVENLGRRDLNPIQEAQQMKRLEDLKVPQKEIGKLFGGRSQPVVANTLKLLKLPSAVQQLVVSGGLTSAHGQELVRFTAWPKVCVCLARYVVKANSGEGWDDPISAKDLREDVLPLDHMLVEAKLAVNINVSKESWNRETSYTVSAELGAKPGFFKSGYSHWTYLLPEDGSPNLWEPEREKQDKAQAAAKEKKQEKNEQVKKSGKPTAEQKKRADKLQKNKDARSAIEATLAHGLLELKDSPKLHIRALAIVCDFVLGSELGDMDEVAQALGLKKIPAGPTCGFGFGEGAEDLEKMGAELMVKVAAAAIMLKESAEARRFASAVPESCSFIAGAAAKKAVANSVQVSVRAKGSDYFAKANNAEASATSGADHAAKAAAAKHFSTNSAFIDLHLVQEGSQTDGTKWIFTAMKAEKGGK